MPQEAPQDQLIDAEQVSNLLGVSRAFVYRATKRGEIPFYSLGRGPKAAKRYRKSEVMAWLESQRNEREERA